MLSKGSLGAAFKVTLLLSLECWLLRGFGGDPGAAQWQYFMFANSGSIQALLSAPNPDDPLAENIAKHWKSDEAEAVATGLYLNWALSIFWECISLLSVFLFKAIQA
jgi:hypothetical protein